ncbi:unnamed protein product [Somion occarium]|uniref:AB hydrolase-1 domain-containing protein n=1 Tax=Somion occarium TaxID=3059160 RepID=A0ABP1D5B0_9APHY
MKRAYTLCQSTQLYYEDSGVPDSAPTDYKTLVIVHGTMFNGGIFKRILPFASHNKARVILVNQRDYQHSTPFNKEELEALTSHNKDQQDSFIRDRVRELANCLIWLIEHEDIPPISSDRKTGGLAVIGWSSGNCLMFPFLALSDEVISDKNQKDVLSKNIRAVVIYEAAGLAWGLPSPPSVEDLALTYEMFGPLVGAYFDHRPEILDYLESPSLDKFTTDDEVHSVLSYMPATDRTPTMDRVPAEILSEVAEPPETFYRSMIPVLILNSELYRSYATLAVRAGAFPNAPVEVVVCGRSLANIVHGAYRFQRDLLEDRLVRKIENQRKTSFHVWREFNHCPQWDEPGKFIELMTDVA